jgi:lipopolysaccharide export system protein LptC
VSKAAKSQPRLEFRSEFLHAFTDTERVKSNKPVEIVRGRDTFTADAMDFDNLERVLQLDGRVKGVLVPDAFK